MSRAITTQPYPTIEERLDALKRSRDLAPGTNGDNGVPAGCKFEIEIPRDVWSKISVNEGEVYKFLQNQGVDTLMKAYYNVTGVSLPRGGGEGHLDCKVSDKGWECKGGISIGF